MSMLGIGGQPYLDLTPHLDLRPLVALNDEIAFGLAMADPPRTETGKLRWEGETRTDVATMTEELWATGTPQQKQKLQKLVAAARGAFDKAYLYTQLVHGGYTGSYSLILRRNTKGYHFKNDETGSYSVPECRLFPGLMAYIETLPFASIGSIAIYMTENDCVVPIHRDFAKAQSERANEFIWFSPQLKKRFFIFDEANREKYYVKSRAILFNELDFHGVDALPETTVSIRVDGRFTPEFRRRIGIDDLRMPEMRPRGLL